MILQDHLARIVQGRTDRRQLDQDFGAVDAVLHHPLHLLQVADGPGQTVDNGLLIFVDMAVGMGQALGMLVDMVVAVHPAALLFGI